MCKVQCSICGKMKVNSDSSFTRCYTCNQKYKDLSEIINEQGKEISELKRTVHELMDMLLIRKV